MNNIKQISLVLTQRCNLNCVYCYENFKSQNSMPFDIAKKALDKHLSDNSYKEVIIDFFGGEPFIEFDLMKKIFEYVESLKINIPHRFTATTNGTLVHRDIQSWLNCNKNKYHVTLSLDGTPQMHDYNRSNSYSRIDLDFFKKYLPSHPVKMTISQKSLHHLSDGVKHIHTLGFSVQNNLAYGIDWSSYENILIFEREVSKLLDFYLQYPDIKPCSLLDMEIQGVITRSDQPRRWCGAGANMITVDVDGEEYPCQTFLPLSIGVKKASVAQKINFSSTEDLVSNECKDCILLPVCPTCYGMNFDCRGNVNRRDENLCRFTKIRALACSWLQAHRIMAGKEQRKNVIEAVVKIQKHSHILN